MECPPPTEREPPHESRNPLTVLRGRLASGTGATVAGYASANLTALAVSLVGSFVQARYVDPSDLGLFRSFGIATTYLFVLQGGVFDGLQREIPYLTGDGKAARVRELAAASLSWVLAWSALGIVAFGMLAAVSLAAGNGKAAIGWAVQAVVLTGYLYGGYLQTTFRTSGEFGRISKGKLASSCLTAAVLPLFPFASYAAMALRALVTPAADLAIMHRLRPMRCHPQLDLRSLAAVMRIGIPRYAVAYMESSLWVALEATLALRLLGHSALGLLSFAAMVAQALTIVPVSIMQIYYPRIAQEYGRSASLAGAARVAIGPTAASVAFSLGAAVLCALFGGSAIRAALPRYADAVTPTLLYTLIVVATSGRLLVYALAAFGSVSRYALATVVALAVFASLSASLAAAGLGLNGILWGSLAGRIVHIGLAGLFLVRLCRQPTGRAASGVAAIGVPVPQGIAP